MPSNLKKYDGSGDPEGHLKIFQAAKKVERLVMPTWCHLFNSTLTESARVFFDDLPPESIDSYDDLKKAFLANYLQQKKCIKDPRRGGSVQLSLKENASDMKATRRGRKQNFDRRGDFWNQQMFEQRRDKFTLLTKSPREILALDKGHTTNECMHLKRQIEEMIKVEKLSHVIKELKQRKDQPQNKQERGNIQQGQAPGNPDEEEEGTEGPMIIEEENEGHFIHRMYVDGGPASKILYEHCFNRIRPEIKNQMVPATALLIGFSSEIIWPLGPISLLRADMTDVPRHIAEHRLNIREGCPPVRKNRRGKIGEVKQQTRTRQYKKKLKKLLMPRHRRDIQNPEGNQHEAEPQKMYLRVEEEMFLGYKVNTKGIKVCPDKVDAVLSLPSPKCLKDVQKLNGKLASLNRFLAKSAEKSLPFFKTLKKCTKKGDFYWIEEAESAFKQMKHLIAKLPALTAPEEKEELIVYVAATKEAVSAVLITEREAKKMPIYFVSHALRGPEVTCTSMKKLVFALVHASKRLKRYFQAHPIIVIMNQPIKQVLSRPEVAGRLQKWCIELGEDAIHYRPRVSVMGQILADFIVERPEEDSSDTPMKVEEELPKPWNLFMDGSFEATNNEAEYEALIAGLWIAEEIERVNQSLREGIKARMDARSKNWIKEISHVLWAHRTMIKSSNGDTPFSLTYGMKAVIPVEIGMPTLRTTKVDMVQKDEALEINLELLEERREQAAIREAKSKAKTEKYYNSRVRIISFKPGDLVYHSNDASRMEGGKLSPKWEGPYEVTEALGKGAYKLRDRDGKQLPRTWNHRNLKKCHVHEM
nr:reverse transcriptase domain-containing protein [Tanacetum cinerariifolium]